MSGPSRLLNDEIVNREIKEEPQWKQRRLREVTYHEQAEGLVPTKNTTNGDKQAFSTRKAQVHWMLLPAETATTAAATSSDPTELSTLPFNPLRKSDSMKDFGFLKDDYKLNNFSNSSLTQKTAISLEDADVGLNADIFRLPKRSAEAKTIFHLGREKSGGPMVLMRGRRVKSVVAAADASHFNAGYAADDALLRNVGYDLRQGQGRRPSRMPSPALKHSKVAIHVPPRTAHRVKHPIKMTDSADSVSPDGGFLRSSLHLSGSALSKRSTASKAGAASSAAGEAASGKVRNDKLKIFIRPDLKKGDFAITELAVDLDKINPALPPNS